jgi:drug/metabolite transporter, DME family
MTPQIIALISAFSYAGVAIFARLGLGHANAFAATAVALCVRTVTLWSAVFLSGGVPPVAASAVAIFVFLGVMQTGTSLMTFTGVAKIGASRSQPLRSSYPLWSALIAIMVLQEEASIAVLGGTLLVVAGVILISWRPEGAGLSYRWWDVFFPLGASFLAGIAFPIRRYALSISKEPLFFAALLAAVSLFCLTALFVSGIGGRKFKCERAAALPLIMAGGCESLAALLSLVAVSVGRVVVVAPIVATSPLWTMMLTAIFLRGLERLNARTIAGTLAVVVGTIAIIALG